MNLTQSLFRNAVFYILALIAFAFWGFWATYLSRDQSELLLVDHVHGLSMFAWCFALAWQAGMIRLGRRPLHRLLGRVFLCLIPVILISTLMLSHAKLNQRGLEGFGPLILALQLFLLIQFIWIVCLAVRHRKQPDVHARYMVATVFPMIDPIFNRILSIPLAEDWPFLEKIAIFITFGMTNLIVLVLLYVDWRSGYGRPVFRNVLAIVLLTQIPILALLFAPGWAAVWGGFAEWYLSL